MIIPKEGDRSVCDYRDITLLSVLSEVFSRVLILRIQDSVESQLRAEQAGFRKERSSTEQLHIYLYLRYRMECGILCELC